MGSFLSKLRPPQPALLSEARTRRRGRDRRPAFLTSRARPTSPAPPAPSARRNPIQPSVPTAFLESPWRPSRRDCGTSPHHFGITPPRRYPIQQAQYSCVLPMLCQNGNGSHRKHVLSPGNSRVECRPSTVRITPPGSKLAHFPIAAQIHNAPDPWSKEAVLHALEHWKMKRRTVEGEEDQSSAAAQEEKRRCHDSSGSGHSALKPLVANGVPAAFVPKPRPLKRGLSSQSSDGHLHKRPCTSPVSSLTSMCTCGVCMSSRSAITSSYSSTGGISRVHALGRVEEVGSFHSGLSITGLGGARMLGALRWGRGERRAPRCPLVPRGRRSRSHCQLHSPAGSSPPGRGSCRDSRGVSACTGASASLGALLRPASGSGELPAVAEPLRGPGGAPDTPPGRTGPASTPASPVAGPAPSALAPPPPPLPRGAAGGRLPASQRHLPKRSRPAPPGGLQLSGSRRGSRGRAASLPPPPPQARSTRAGAAAARPPPRQGRRASLRFLIYAPEEASQCLNILQPSLILLADTREASKENKRRGCFSGIWLFCSAGKQGVPGRTEDHRTQDNIQTTSTPARTQRLAKGPPALLPGHSITTEDFDRQKQAQSQWLKRDFEDKTETASNSDSANPPATPPASTLALPAAGTATSSASPQAPMTNPLFLPKYIIFLKKLNPLGLPSFPGTSTPTFGQNTPDPGVGASGSSLSSGVSSAPAQGFAGPGTFGCGPFPSGKRRG